ncbi:MAG: RodZ domain-containing protein [Pseudomonadota bacterium]
MTPEAPAPVVDETPAASESPGALIRRTRERAGMSLEDLAGQIKLSKTTLDALERDGFAQLGQPVYVRGYYRKCAKVLPLSEQQLIAAYETRVKPVAPVTPQRIPLAGGVSSGAAQGQSRQTLIIVAAVGVLIGGLYWFSGGETQRSVTKPAAQITEVPMAAADVAPAESQIVEPVALPPVAEATPVETPAAIHAEPAAPANQLTLQFLEASWVRIEDSRNKTLLIGLVRAGEKQALNGEPPYTAFIGNARKVRAEFNGQPFDFSRHIQGNDTARFSVP